MHVPSGAITLWLIFSVPLVLWDASYVLLRPHLKLESKLHSPIWTPYALYGTIDYLYGWPAFNARNEFTIAQTILNLIETAGYIYYLVIVYTHGVTAGNTSRGQRKTKKGPMWMLKESKVVTGRPGATALLVAYSASVMTLAKTALFCESPLCCKDWFGI